MIVRPKAKPTLVDEHSESLEDSLARLAPTVKVWLFRQLGPGVDVDDALQDALTELAKAIPRFDGRSKLSTYAFRITMRVGSRYIRRRAKAREVHLELVAPPADQVNPESRAMSREALRRLYAVLDRLPAKRRTAFILCCIEGMKPLEAAEIEGVSSDVMRSRLRHARAEVTRRLRGDAYLATAFGGHK